jgi:hypothetical protein
MIVRMSVNDDIDAITQRGEERTAELNSKYEGLNLNSSSPTPLFNDGREKTFGQGFVTLTSP